MISKCRFCDFKRETELPPNILSILAQPDLPAEDMALWAERMYKVTGFYDWNGVKVHMGRMHKGDAYYGMWPDTSFSKTEKEIINDSKKQD